MIADFIAPFQNEVFTQAVYYAIHAWPIWLPLILLNESWHLWLDYIHRHWLNKQGSVLVEIKIPREVEKTPAAMEFVLNGIWENANIATPEDAFWTGKMREWFSLEIVALKGEVRFFVWAFPRWKKIIESRVYAQYPGAEVVEVEDYARGFTYNVEKNTYFGVNTELVKPNAYPIKTYIDYELDKVKLKEQTESIDPITPILEYLGSFKPHEIGIVQILLRAHAKENYLYGHIIPKKDWKSGIKDEIKKIIEEEAPIKPEEGKPASMMALTDNQKETIKSIERNAGKLAFDTMIRLFYFAPKDGFERTRGIGMIGSMRQFGTHNLNGIKPKFFLPTHAWEDFREIRKRDLQRAFVDAVRRRAFFGVPHFHLYGNPYILTTEEVATLFHIPGAMATTPTLKRAPSKKAEAPANLPI